MIDLTDFRKQKDNFFEADQHSPLSTEQKQNFQGLSYFQENPALRFDLEVKPFDEHNQVQMQTSTGEIAPRLMNIQDSVRLTFDSNVVDPMGRQSFMHGSQELLAGAVVYVTNNTLLNHGDKFSPNGGHIFWSVVADTLYIENNSFISSDNNVVSNNASPRNIDFLWFNHNTVVFHDVGLIPNYELPSTYVTNNLFYDLSTYVQQHGWAVLDPDNGNTGTYPTLIRVDTALVDGVNEPLPSSRTCMWNRNSVYVSDAVKDTILGASVSDPTDN